MSTRNPTDPELPVDVSPTSLRSSASPDPVGLPDSDEDIAEASMVSRVKIVSEYINVLPNSKPMGSAGSLVQELDDYDLELQNAFINRAEKLFSTMKNAYLTLYTACIMPLLELAARIKPRQKELSEEEKIEIEALQKNVTIKITALQESVGVNYNYVFFDAEEKDYIEALETDKDGEFKVFTDKSKIFADQLFGFYNSHLQETKVQEFQEFYDCFSEVINNFKNYKNSIDDARQDIASLKLDTNTRNFDHNKYLAVRKTVKALSRAEPAQLAYKSNKFIMAMGINPVTHPHTFQLLKSIYDDNNRIKNRWFGANKAENIKRAFKNLRDKQNDFAHQSDDLLLQSLKDAFDVYLTPGSNNPNIANSTNDFAELSKAMALRSWDIRYLIGWSQCYGNTTSLAKARQQAEQINNSSPTPRVASVLTSSSSDPSLPSLPSTP